MNKLLLVSLLLILMTSIASAVVEVHFPAPKVQQGSLQKAVLIIDAKTAQSFELQKLKDQTVGDVLYFYSVSPMIRKEGGADFEAEAKVVFAKVPETPFASLKTPQSEIVFNWGNVEVVPVEAPQELLFGTFEIPGRSKILLWLGIALGLVLLGLGGHALRKKLALKNEIKNRRIKIRDEIQLTANYEDVVLIWRDKRRFIKEFPHLEESFKSLEKTLFKHQFKPTQTEAEKNEVLKAWNVFLEDTKGGFDGI